MSAAKTPRKSVGATRKKAPSKTTSARGNPKSASGWTALDLVLVAVSAGAMYASFPPVGWWFLMIPSLALLVGILDRVGPLRAAGYGALWAMAFFMPHISWMMVATGGTWGAWIALAAAQAFFLALWAGSFSALGTWAWARSVPGEALGGALLWVTFEELRSRIPFGGFAWAKLAYPQVDSPMVAYAPLGGEVLVAFLVVVCAVLLRRGLAVVGTELSLPSLPGRLAALALLAVIAVAPALVRLPNAQQAGALDVGLVQGNVEIPHTETYAAAHKVTGNHVAETLHLAEEVRGGGEAPELVFWGEHSVDTDPRTDEQTAAMIQQASDAVGVPMTVGFTERDGDVRYNWVGTWYPAGGAQMDPGLAAALYGKQHPVPWGEYVPLRDLTLKLAPAAAQIGVDLAPVENPGFMEVTLNDGRVVPISVGICFEVAYQPLITEGVLMGGQLIYIPTNNAHFQETAESLQQLQMVQFRAAEFSRAALQVSTNGVSAIVRPDGSVQAQTGMQVAAGLLGTVPLRTAITPAARIEGLLSWAVMLAGGALAVASIGAHLYGKSLRRRG